MKYVRAEGCHVGLFREFVVTACCTYGQSNTTINMNEFLARVINDVSLMMCWCVVIFPIIDICIAVMNVLFEPVRL